MARSVSTLAIMLTLRTRIRDARRQVLDAFIKVAHVIIHRR